MDAVYGSLVQIILNLFILQGGKLPLKGHCNFLHGINDPIPIDVMREQRCIKFIWTLLYSHNNNCNICYTICYQ